MLRKLILLCITGISVQNGALAGNSAAFQGLDTTTKGNWKGAYGQDGYVIANDSNVLPQYATANSTGTTPYTWIASSTDPRALLKGSSATDRIASTFYSSSSFSFDINLTDGLPHRLAVYSLDLETNERKQTVSILDAGTNAVLNSQQLSGFHNGVYAVWNVQGHIILKVTYVSGLNGVLSGIFFGGGAPPGPPAPTVNLTSPVAGTVSGTVTLTANAASTVGLASVQFQLDGANLGSPVTGSGPLFSAPWDTTASTNGSHTLKAIAVDTLSQQTTSAGVTVSVANAVSPPVVNITAPSPGAASGLVTLSANASSSVGIASVQFRLDGVAVGSPVTGSGPVYSMSWNSAGAANGAHTLTALATDTLGQQTTSATVTVSVSNTGSTAAATFVKTDGVTKGTWKGTYGADGYIIANDSNIPPAYATVTSSGAPPYTWTPSSTDPRVLLKGASATDRIASAFYTSTNMTFDVTLTDGSPHQVALYCLDLETTTRAQTISILNASTNAVLDSRPMSGFNGGVYGVWNLQGHVLIRITFTGGLNAVVSGLFFGGSAAPPPPPTVSMTAPSGGTVSGTVSVAATAASAVGLASVQFQLDGTTLGAPVGGGGPNFTMQWNTSTATAGAHTLRAVATDTQGQSTPSASVNVVVANSVVLPTVSITSPPSGPVSGQISVTANAFSPSGIASVQFRLDGANLGQPVTGVGPTYSSQWATAGTADGPHALTAVATDTLGQQSTSSSVAVNVANGSTTQPSATFVGLDTTTKGNWKGSYGQDGYLIPNDSNLPPSYARIVPAGAAQYTWVASTTDPRGLLKGGSATDRIASTYYSGGSFSFDLDLSDGQLHRVALYLLDFDSTSRGETISILNAATNAVLGSQPMANFNGGVYAIWNLQGHVIIRITYTGGLNAVLSGLLFGGNGSAPPPPPTVSMTSPPPGALSGNVPLAASASAAAGMASVQFQLDGTNLGPAIAGVGPSFSSSWTSTQSTNGAHTLTAVAADALGQKTTSASVVVTVANPTLPPTVSIVSPGAGAVSGTTTLSANASSPQGMASVQFKVDGVNLGAAVPGVGPTFSSPWNTLLALPGSHTLTALATDTLGLQTTSAGVAVTVSNGTVVTPSAVFVGVDTTTQGTWKGSYGQDGYIIPNDSNVPPAYATVTITGAQPYTWWPSSTDPRALLKGASSTDRIASAYYTGTTLTFDINLTDGNVHQVGFYCMDLETTSRSETISILSADTNAVLSMQPMSGFNGGQYAVWNLQGHVLVKVAYKAGLNAVISGIFFGFQPGPPTINLTSPAAGTVSGIVNLSATASAPGGLTSVQFKVDGANLGAPVLGTGPSFSTQWVTTPQMNGAHTLGAVATDKLSQQGTSAAVQVNVFNQGPALDVSNANVTFSAVALGSNPTGQNVSILNTGGGTLNWTASKSQSWVILSAAAGTGPASLGLSVNVAGLAAGTYTDTVTIAAAGATGSPKTVTITLNLGVAPNLTLSATALSFNGTAGAANPAGQSVNITNSGGASLVWTAAKTQSWLGLSPSGGTAPSSLGITVDTTGRAAGTYNDTITVTGTGSTGSPQTISVTLTLIPPPKLTLSSTSLSSNGTAGAASPPAQSVSISNTGGGTLSWTAAKTQSWVSLSDVAGTAPSSLGVSIDTTGLAAGTYHDTLTITAPGAVSSPQTVAITLTLIPPPHLTLSSQNLTYSATVGAASPAGQNVTITNTGGGTLSWTAVKTQPWLTVSSSGGTAPSSLGITLNTVTLNAGTYTDTVTISAPGAEASPQSITVTLTMIPPPIISLSTTGLNPSGAVLAPSPTAQNISISNAGGGTLNWTASKSQSWLSLSPGLGTAPATLVVSFNTTALAAGTYTDVITIQGTGAVNSPQTVGVTLTMAPPSLPVANWTFDTATISNRTVLDTSGDNITANILGTVSTGPGKVGQALNFDGASTYLTAGSDVRLAMKGDLTLATWIRTTNHTRQEIIFGKYDYSGSEDGYVFQVTAAGYLALHFGGSNNPNYRDMADNTNAINDGNWHHVACVMRLGQDISFYVDGGLSSIFYFTTFGGGISGPIGIGGPASFLGNLFTGSMDELRVYGRALSSQDIGQLYGDTITTSAGGERLYNGIALPLNFPPPTLPTQVPRTPYYLKSPPRVIPIDVGRQLFVDDFLVEQTTLQRTVHQPVMRSSPVLAPGSPISAGAWYDPTINRYKMWYYDTTPDYRYAVSIDGINWTRPTFPDVLVPNTNEVVAGGDTIWQDLQEPNPARRYKSFQVDPGAAKIYVYFSPDGIHWGPRQDYNIKSISDRTSVFWNPFRRVWVNSDRGAAGVGATLNRPGYSPRVRFYSESADLLNWNPADPAKTFWTGPDDQDLPYYGAGGEFPELYNLDCVAYESVLLGLFSWFQPGAGYKDYVRPGPVLVEIGAGFSRDGFSWIRPNRGTGPSGAFIPASNVAGTWNAYNTQSVGGGLLVVGDELWFYFSARSGKKPENGDFATGLATLRRDGFYSMDAGSTEATLTTRPVRFTGNHLFVNVDDPSGQLRVEVLDANGNVLVPFSKSSSNPVATNKTLQEVTWNGANLAALAGQSVKFKFYLTNGRLYSFWVTPSAQGASNGYVAAGGPGFTGVTDTVGGIQ
ncbi:MAG: Ig-like domain-containing protein [Candidatus Solibacter sp.]